ncbi:ribosomal RNA small subunit methyltransferase A [Candidatus Parcubacteria bacterium A4]|nr:MAG: ribosomal RNA small subunit methyltransferase A [Candidatus Parcubacteria bacterium A4]
MDLDLKTEIKRILQENAARPLKIFGQNFLINQKMIEKMTEGVSKKDVVLEIGPGLGVLTKELSKKAKMVIAVEKDRKMVELLGKTIAPEYPNVKIVNDDILKFQISPASAGSRRGGTTYKIVANLPFYLTSPVIRMFLEAENPPTDMTLIIQKEVAQRICAKPPKMSILANSVQFYAEPKIICYISKDNFWPEPKVDCAIIKISNIERKQVPTAGEKKSKTLNDMFFRVVKAGFSHPRKQLINNLRQLSISREEIEKWLLINEIKPTQRAETLTVKDWITLSKSLPHRISVNQLNSK